MTSFRFLPGSHTIHRVTSPLDAGKWDNELLLRTTLRSSFDDAVAKITAALKEEGFGIITEIDVKETLKRKLDVDFRRYKILGLQSKARPRGAEGGGQGWDDVALQCDRART